MVIKIKAGAEESDKQNSGQPKLEAKKKKLIKKASIRLILNDIIKKPIFRRIKKIRKDFFQSLL